MFDDQAYRYEYLKVALALALAHDNIIILFPIALTLAHDETIRLLPLLLPLLIKLLVGCFVQANFYSVLMMIH